MFHKQFNYTRSSDSDRKNLGINQAYFVNWSTITKMLSFPIGVLDRPTIKSIVIDFNFKFGTSRGCKNLGLYFVQSFKFDTSNTSLHILNVLNYIPKIGV